MKKHQDKFLFLMAGAMYALSFPFKGSLTFFPLIFLSAAIYFSQFFKSKGKVCFKQITINTLIFLWSYNLVGYYWLSFTLKTFGGLAPPLNYLLWQLFTLIIAPQFYLFILATFFLRKINLSFASKSLVLSVIWTLLEYYTPQQFPAHFGHTWLVFAPYLKITQYFGVPIFTFITVLTGMTLFLNLYKKERMIFNWVVIVLTVLINFSIGPIEEIIDGSKVNIRLVQANIGNDLKLKSENGMQLASYQVVDIFKRMSKKESIGEIDLTIWPETSYPRVFMTSKSKVIPSELSSLISNRESFFFIGTYDLASNRADLFEQQYNTTLLFDNTGAIQDVYHKRVLIPFGEGLPFGPFNKFFSKFIKNISFFATGKNYTQFTFKDQSFISLICYEVLFPRYVRSYLNAQKNQPKFIINLTNDSWYGRYSEQEQHLFLAKWRAVEFNIPMIRATNTGISAVILNNGLEQERLGNYVQDIMDFTLTTKISKRTIYQKGGILPFLILSLMILALSFILRSPLLKGRAS